MKNAPVHGATDLGSVTVETYNAELRDTEGFIGDRASNRAFREIVEELRDRLRQTGEDPLGDTPTADLSRKKLDKVLVEGDPEAAGLVHGAIEEFAVEFTAVIKRFLKLKGWREVRSIVVGGGLRASRIGELVIGRSAVLLKSTGHNIRMLPIHHHPDHAGLVGAVHLAPTWMFEGHEAILAVDIGGSNLRAGVVELNLKKKKDLSKCAVHELDLWRYADEPHKPTREEAVTRIGEMLRRLIRHAEGKVKLAPFIGLACPGLIASNGQIESGGQNLPGNWESSRFNLPEKIREMVPRVRDHDTMVVMHNDAVVQGLSELPFISSPQDSDDNDERPAAADDSKGTPPAKGGSADAGHREDEEKEEGEGDLQHWGVMTIGTGLGNAAFSHRVRRRKGRGPART